jgi:hypothetical protein
LNIFKKTEKLKPPQREREREGEGEKTTTDVTQHAHNSAIIHKPQKHTKNEKHHPNTSNKSKEQPWNRLKKRSERTGLEKGVRELDWKLE